MKKLLLILIFLPFLSFAFQDIPRGFITSGDWKSSEKNILMTATRCSGLMIDIAITLSKEPNKQDDLANDYKSLYESFFGLAIKYETKYGQAEKYIREWVDDYQKVRLEKGLEGIKHDISSCMLILEDAKKL